MSYLNRKKIGQGIFYLKKFEIRMWNNKMAILIFGANAAAVQIKEGEMQLSSYCWWPGMIKWLK